MYVESPLQRIWLAGVADPTGRGLTNTVAVIALPVHPFAVGMMVKVTVIGMLVILVSVPLMLPLPLAGIPVTVTKLSLFQLKIVPDTLPVSSMVVIGLPEHFVCDDGLAIALGTGLTVIWNVQVLVQPLELV